MNLKFKLVKLPPSGELSEKLSKLGVTPFIEQDYMMIKGPTIK